MKKHLTLFLYLGLLVLGGTSCSRSDSGTTVVEGQVVDLHTGQPVADAAVTVYSRRKEGSAYNGVEFDKQTDGNGKFSFSFEAESGKSYAALGHKAPGYYTPWTDAAYLHSGQSNKKLKLKMQAPAWVRVKLVNVPPMDTIRSFYIQSFSDMIDGQVSATLLNINHDTSFIRMVEGNMQNTFLCNIIETNGNDKLFNPTSYFPALDTTDLIISY